LLHPFFVMTLRPSLCTLFPYTTLFRSRPDVEVVILEAADRIGGKLASADIAGVRVDVGAEALLCRRPEGLDLIDSVGLREHVVQDRKSTRLNSSHVSISYAVFCLKKKN